MKKEKEEKIIKYLRSLILRTLAVIVLLLDLYMKKTYHLLKSKIYILNI